MSRLHPTAAAIRRVPQRPQSARQDLALEAAITRLDRYDPLTLDNLSYVRKDQAETSVLFKLISKRYERRRMLITASKPFAEWNKVFPNPSMTIAAVDRLVHHSVVVEINVESHRQKAATSRKGRGAPIKGDNQRNDGEETTPQRLRPTCRLPVTTWRDNHLDKRCRITILIDARNYSDRRATHVRPAGTAFSVTRDPDGLATLMKHLLSLPPKLIVLEATGGFEMSVASAIASAGLPLTVVNSRQVRDFARACGRLAKTDTLEARAIALFAERIQPDPRPVSDKEARLLTDLVARRRQMVDMRWSRQKGTANAKREIRRSQSGSVPISSGLARSWRALSVTWATW